MSERNLRDGFDKPTARKRLAYAVAAGAAMAAADDACAEIIYSGIANFPIDQGMSRPLNFDLDDYQDVLLKNYIFSGVNYQALTVGFAPGKVVGFSTNGSALFGEYVKALSAGFMIDSSSVGPTFYGTLAFGAGNPNAQFKNVEGAYIGLSFPHGDVDLYYAWIRVNINNTTGLFTIVDWAWENQVGVGIAAGDTGDTSTPGDFNLDGKVDGLDFLLWQRGGSPSGTTPMDLQDWQDNYGTGSIAAATAVPEPITLGLLACGSTGLALLRRARKR